MNQDLLLMAQNNKPHSVWKLYSETTGAKVSATPWQHLVDSAKGINIPSQTLITYDAINGTNTRYGMDASQTMLDPEYITQIALDVILNSDDITAYTRDQIVNMLTTDVGNALNEFYDTLPIKVINTLDRKSTRLNSSHSAKSRMPSSA